MIELVAADIGGTNARFALASVSEAGEIALGEPITLGTSDFVSLHNAWHEFGRRLGTPLPSAAAFAIAAPVTGAVLRLTNNSWTIDTGKLDEQLGLERVSVLNDFEAVAHAVATAPDNQFEHLCGPDIPLPRCGTISVIGPGTGLGVAHFHRFSDNSGSGYHVQATEGGHLDFAPVDHIDDAILLRLRDRLRRVSVERVISGPGIFDIYYTLAKLEQRSVTVLDDATIWQRGTSGADPLATAAIDRFCMSLGSVAGDFALAHGAAGVVIAGGVGLRLRDRLPASGFAERFGFKGRYEQLMASLPVKLITQAQPGLFGAVAAFAKEHCPT
jgi:glucokinase